jgi:hypothetical protein
MEGSMESIFQFFGVIFLTLLLISEGPKKHGS